MLSSRHGEGPIDVDILIPAAGAGSRMRSFGNRSLLKFGGRTLLQWQFRELRKVFPHLPIRVVGGMDAVRLREHLPQQFPVVVNWDWEETNAAYSIALGLEKSTADYTLVIYGDLLFNSRFLSGFPEGNVVWCEPTKGKRDKRVGMNLSDEVPVHFAYGLPYKWSQAFVLDREAREVFINLMRFPNRKRYLTHEIFNLMMEEGISFQPYEPNFGKVLELNTPNVLRKLRSI